MYPLTNDLLQSIREFETTQILANLRYDAKSLRVIGSYKHIPISPLLLPSLLPSLSLPFLPPFPLLFKRKDKSFGYHNYQKIKASCGIPRVVVRTISTYCSSDQTSNKSLIYPNTRYLYPY